jgi:hypothetical protein
MLPFLWASSPFQKIALNFKSSPKGVKSPNLVTLTQSHAEVKEKATCFKFIFCQKVFDCSKCIAGNGKNFQMKIWSLWYKNTAVNYCGNFNPTFSRIKIPRYIITTLG